MLIQVKNKILLLEAVSYAAIAFPDRADSDDFVTLDLIIDGHSLKLTGQPALTIWLAIQQQSDCLVPMAENSQIAHAPFQ
ncbi:MAG: hypothetical protein KME07_21415 [Pegethrix bostrychoides GSE-TBD4-15B]|jgi:hypothetical protein|uniref:Uncharacterized protein n=1 Tax=Pegethrix bostrychoides GSE-TBD4-15B TaxID=2839662 RepID=A0A951PER0_9CYAN|nr:hypothetical protein [Pegethrix bostrychoides GSE-TBD4-15B]